MRNHSVGWIDSGRVLGDVKPSLPGEAREGEMPVAGFSNTNQFQIPGTAANAEKVNHRIHAFVF